MSADSQMCDPNEGYTTTDGKHKIVDLCPVSCGRCGGGKCNKKDAAKHTHTHMYTHIPKVCTHAHTRPYIYPTLEERCETI